MEKPDSKLEKYAFLRLYEHDFEMALNTLKVLRRCRNNEVRYALLRDIIITYCRPFTESKGKQINRHHFGFGKFESESMKGLHKKIIDLRKSLFAHTDLIFKNPQIVNWSTTERKWFPISFTSFDYVQLDNETLEIEHLIKYSKKQLLEQIRELENGF